MMRTVNLNSSPFSSVIRKAKTMPEFAATIAELTLVYLLNDITSAVGYLKTIHFMFKTAFPTYPLEYRSIA